MPASPSAWMTPLASQIAARSEAQWGRTGIVRMIGVSSALQDALDRTSRFARVDRPVLIQGESGVGKELFARSCYLLSPRSGTPFLSVNCAQFVDENLLISELFGHKKGAFTGAASDRKGLFEEAERGVLFLDEVGELTPRAQAALLRAIGVGEVVRLGESKARRVDVRVVAATNRDLRAMVSAGTFREDLYYRLAPLRLHVPPLRERGDDWRLIAEAYLAQLCRQYGEVKRFTEDALARLARHSWPGNVREVRGLLDMAFCLASGERIEASDIEAELTLPMGDGALPDAALEVAAGGTSRDPFARMSTGEASFWTVVRDPYLDRELNRDEVRQIVERGLAQSGGSYKRALRAFGLPEAEYLKFMDFLRHHRLKPKR
ncbi:MAG: sigma 54-interacting transcriptional regulator [Bacteroidota bacterium]